MMGGPARPQRQFHKEARGVYNRTQSKSAQMEAGITAKEIKGASLRAPARSTAASKPNAITDIYSVPGVGWRWVSPCHSRGTPSALAATEAGDRARTAVCPGLGSLLWLLAPPPPPPSDGRWGVGPQGAYPYVHPRILSSLRDKAGMPLQVQHLAPGWACAAAVVGRQCSTKPHDRAL